MSRESENRGLMVLDIMESSRVSVLDLNPELRLEDQIKCPACVNELKPFAVLTNGKNSQQIRVGVCQACGYLGYIDRPAKEWMVNFYSRDWDREFARPLDDVKKNFSLPTLGVKASRYLAVSLAEKLVMDKNKPVCEIGSGYGQTLKYLYDRGWRNLVGIENSKHRAELVNKAFGFKILWGDFENLEIQSELSKIRPFGLIFSHHVFEHTYHPAEIIEKISKLQEAGDNLILALPNAQGEHINYRLLYLPHLHSFTKESLEILLNKYGYEIVADNSPDFTNIIIAAKKVARPMSKYSRQNDYYQTAVQRVVAGLRTAEVSRGELTELYWRQDIEKLDVAKIVSQKKDNFLNLLVWKLKKALASVKTRFNKFTVGYTMLVKTIEAKTGNGPLVIKFKGNIKLLVK